MTESSLVEGHARQERDGLGIIVIPTIVTAVNFGVFAPKSPRLPRGQECRHLPAAGGSGIRRTATTTRSGMTTVENQGAGARL